MRNYLYVSGCSRKCYMAYKQDLDLLKFQLQNFWLDRHQHCFLQLQPGKRVATSCKFLILNRRGKRCKILPHKKIFTDTTVNIRSLSFLMFLKKGQRFLRSADTSIRFYELIVGFLFWYFSYY